MGRNRTNTIAILSRKEKIQYNWEAVTNTKSSARRNRSLKISNLRRILSVEKYSKSKFKSRGKKFDRSL
jgi:hypothetical protein